MSRSILWSIERGVSVWNSRGAWPWVCSMSVCAYAIWVEIMLGQASVAHHLHSLRPTTIWWIDISYHHGSHVLISHDPTPASPISVPTCVLSVSGIIWRSAVNFWSFRAGHYAWMAGNMLGHLGDYPSSCVLEFNNTSEKKNNRKYKQTYDKQKNTSCVHEHTTCGSSR